MTPPHALRTALVAALLGACMACGGHPSDGWGTNGNGNPYGGGSNPFGGGNDDGGAPGSGDGGAGSDVGTNPTPGTPDAQRPAPTPGPTIDDKFGTREIYPTVPGGREWYIDMANPTADPDFVFSSATGTTLVHNADGSWKDNEITNSMSEGARLQVVTNAGETQWKNVEITGYVKLLSTPDMTERFSWYGRSGQHTDTLPCDGTAYHMQLGYDGSVWYQKEVWHTGGYTAERRGQLSGVVPTVLGQWVGFKAMIYNIDGDAHVEQEIWVDANATNDWVQVNTVIDQGGWTGTQPGCQRPQDAILNTARPIVAFRADNAEYDFKNYSVREISPP